MVRSTQPTTPWLGIYLRTFRERANLTAQELAIKLGVSQPYICRVETGRSPASPQFLINAAKALKEDPKFLLLAGGHLPDEFKEWIVGNPAQALTYFNDKIKSK